jgi:hypothetical protein
LQTIAVSDDSSALGNLAGVSSGRNTSTFASDPGSPGFLGIGSEAPSSSSSTFSDSGWAISRTWLETVWDRIRWGIGIKEIGIYSYRYAETSEFVSIPYVSPTTISKVSLKVDELIPTTFPNSQRWIQYFVTGDNGKTWYQINPLDKPSLFSGDNSKPVPRILNFNPDFSKEDDDENKYIRTTQPVTSVRLRVVFIRPGGNDNSLLSPILKSYRLMIYPNGGLQ